MSLSPVIVIPARMASSRLPGKPMANICGEPMIVHVWRRAVESELGPVVVACAETEIAQAITAVGGHAVLTRPDHPSGSDRVFEAVEKFDPKRQYNAVINVQGDLPTLDPAVIRATFKPLEQPGVDIATLITEITDPSEWGNPNVVKAIVGLKEGESVGRALYFTRATAPSGEGPLYHHIGLYSFQRESLRRFISLPQGVLERRERLEQLRALENGMRIDAALVDTSPLGVDTPAELERARILLAERS